MICAEGVGAASALALAALRGQRCGMVDRLEMFIALAQERHFGRAAERLGITQPSLSSAIKALEANFGVQLVRRGSRFQGLTAEGEHVYLRALDLVAGMRALKDEMRAVRHGLTGDLRIGVIPTALPVIADLTTPFTRKHPDLRMAILSRTSAEILAQLEDQLIDVGVTYLDDEAQRRCDCLPLYVEDYALLVPEGHDLAARDSVTWADLKGLPLCLLTRDMQNRRIVDRHLAAAGVVAEPKIESNSSVALLAHVLSGGKVSVVARRLAQLFDRTNAVAAIPIREGQGEPVGLVALRREVSMPAVSALFEAARQAEGR